MTRLGDGLPRRLRLLAMTPLGAGTTGLVIARLRRSRGNLMAVTDGKFHVNDTSQRLPRRFAPRNDSMIGGTYPITKNSIPSDGVLCVGVTYLPV